jgi:hypothetical protein
MLHKRYPKACFEKTCAMPIDMGGTLIGLLLVKQQLKII